MTDEEFHTLVKTLTSGAGFVVVTVRLISALKVAIDVGGTDVAQAVRIHCDTVVANLVSPKLKPE